MRIFATRQFSNQILCSYIVLTWLQFGIEGLNYEKSRRQFFPQYKSSHICSSTGATCEPLLECFLNQGNIAGTCEGFMSVCCEQNVTGRRFRETKELEDQNVVNYGRVINDPVCGRPLTSTKRVLDGEAAGFGSFPWQALIRVGRGKCGGVLINRQHAVTAGHCIKNKLLNTISVTLGEYKLNSLAEPLPTQTYHVSRAVVHPNFKFSPAADRYDVAVLRLDRPVQYAPHIAPICLPEAGRDPSPGTQAYVAGWGTTISEETNGPLIPVLSSEIKRPSLLQVANVPIVANDRCEGWHWDAGVQVKIWPEMVCAGYREGGKDSCKGDSGGPLMVQQADGRWVLVGLVSAGFSCGRPGQPGIYHRISSTSDWISYHMNSRERY